MNKNWFGEHVYNARGFEVIQRDYRKEKGFRKLVYNARGKPMMKVTEVPVIPPPSHQKQDQH